MIRVPVYMEFSTTREFKVRMPKKPKRVLLNANDDVLAIESVVKEM